MVRTGRPAAEPSASNDEHHHLHGPRAARRLRRWTSCDRTGPKAVAQGRHRGSWPTRRTPRPTRPRCAWEASVYPVPSEQMHAAGRDRRQYAGRRKRDIFGNERCAECRPTGRHAATQGTGTYRRSIAGAPNLRDSRETGRSARPGPPERLFPHVRLARPESAYAHRAICGVAIGPTVHVLTGTGRPGEGCRPCTLLPRTARVKPTMYDDARPDRRETTVSQAGAQFHARDTVAARRICHFARAAALCRRRDRAAATRMCGLNFAELSSAPPTALLCARPGTRLAKSCPAKGLQLLMEAPDDDKLAAISRLGPAATSNWSRSGKPRTLNGIDGRRGAKTPGDGGKCLLSNQSRVTREPRANLDGSAPGGDYTPQCSTPSTT